MIWLTREPDTIMGEYPEVSELHGFDDVESFDAWYAGEDQSDLPSVVGILREYDLNKHYPGAGQMMGMMN